jgi:hypothetical protein
MLVLMAALVPILGAIYAAASYLMQQARAAHEYRVRRRLMPMRDERYHRLLPLEMKRYERMGIPFDMDLFLHRLDLTDEVLYRANGISPPPRYRTHALNAAMSTPLLSLEERRRQWILLISSAVGVVLLAVAELTPA